MNDFQERLAKQPPIRNAETLAFVLGDQLDPGTPLIQKLDWRRDAVFMAEAAREAEHVASHRQRTTLFLSAMRHYAADLMRCGMRVRYVRLGDRNNTHLLGNELKRAIRAVRPRIVRITKPGEHRVEAEIRAACRSAGVKLEMFADESFTCSLDEFDEWAEGRKSLVMEYFYRERRRRLDILMKDGKPVGGSWNFDRDNRKAFKQPPRIPRPYAARPDAITREVMGEAVKRFPDAPGIMDSFRWPVAPAQAKRALTDFISRRLRAFGTYEDAMWAGESVLYHSRLSPALNLKILQPHRCLDEALTAYHRGGIAINNVEAFVRQIIGWREFIRGVYYREGSSYTQRNELNQLGNLPSFFWNGETDMRCLRHCLREVIENAWGHHIPRLMVIGNFALIAGVHPRKVHEWFLGMYADAVEWVTAPNVIGMSQHADGGVVGTKPYAASGKYIQRMSNYCSGCRFDPSKRAGEGACPFNILYWDFLLRHRGRFEKNHRMALAMRNAAKIASGERRGIQNNAEKIRSGLGIA